MLQKRYVFAGYNLLIRLVTMETKNQSLCKKYLKNQLLRICVRDKAETLRNCS